MSSAPAKSPNVHDHTHMHPNDLAVMDGALRAVEAFMATEDARQAHMQIKIGFDLVPPENNDNEFKSTARLAVNLSALANLPRARTDVLRGYEEAKRKKQSTRREKCPTSSRSTSITSSVSVSEKTATVSVATSATPRQPAGGDGTYASSASAFYDGAASALSDAILGTAHEPIHWTKVSDDHVVGKKTKKEHPRKAMQWALPSADIYAVKGVFIKPSEHAPQRPPSSDIISSDSPAITPQKQMRIEKKEEGERRIKKEERERKEREDEEKKIREEEGRRIKEKENERRRRDEEEKKRKERKEKERIEKEEDEKRKEKEENDRQKEMKRKEEEEEKKKKKEEEERKKDEEKNKKEKEEKEKSKKKENESKESLCSTESLSQEQTSRESTDISDWGNSYIPRPKRKRRRKKKTVAEPAPTPTPSPFFDNIRAAAAAAADRLRQSTGWITDLYNYYLLLMLASVHRAIPSIDSDVTPRHAGSKAFPLRRAIRRPLPSAEIFAVKFSVNPKPKREKSDRKTSLSLKTPPQLDSETTSKTAQEISDRADCISQRDLPLQLHAPTEQSIGVREMRSIRRDSTSTQLNDEDTLNNIKSIEDEDIYTKRTESDTSIVSDVPALQEAMFDFRRVGEKRTEISFQVQVRDAPRSIATSATQNTKSTLPSITPQPK